MAVLIKTILIAVWFALLFLLENIANVNMRRLPKFWSKFTAHRIMRNISFYLLNGAVYPLVFAITIFASQYPVFARPDIMQHHGFIILDILLLDCMIYWWHRFNHTIPFLWRFHEVHHLDEAMDATTAVRFHFGEVILSAMNRAIFIMWLSIPLTSVIIMETILFMMALFQHANIRLGKADRLLSKIIITPRIHSAHHHAVQQDTDSNYGNFLSIWDRIFGSYNPKIVDKDMRIGVEGAKDQTLWRLLLRPFWQQKRKKL